MCRISSVVRIYGYHKTCSIPPPTFATLYWLTCVSVITIMFNYRYGLKIKILFFIIFYCRPSASTLLNHSFFKHVGKGRLLAFCYFISFSCFKPTEPQHIISGIFFTTLFASMHACALLLWKFLKFFLALPGKWKGRDHDSYWSQNSGLPGVECARFIKKYARNRFIYIDELWSSFSLLHWIIDKKRSRANCRFFTTWLRKFK